MIPKHIQNALIRPAFEPDQITPTPFYDAATKACFTNQLMRFISNDFPRKSFNKKFYNHLCNTFGHIAHYSDTGFFEEFFTSLPDKLRFLRQTIEFGFYGSPAHTFCDVELAVANRVVASTVIQWYLEEERLQRTAAEIALLEKLEAKHRTPGATSAIINKFATDRNPTTKTRVSPAADQSDLFAT
jgi:hypothetical protein